MITLTTDFGDSPYVGALRGAILTVHPQARIVDITHSVPRHDIVSGAFALFSAAPFFPKGTVHVCVVDPGVGTDRKGIAIAAGGHVLVGADNGILVPVARRLGIEQVVELTEGKYFLEEVSRTFHGRDVFGPVAAHLELGVEIGDLGSELDLDDIEEVIFGEPFVKDGAWRTSVINLDRFGNVTLNMPGAQVLDAASQGSHAVVEVGGRRVEVELHKTYGTADPGTPILTVGSAGFAELAITEEDCAAWYGLEVGDVVRIQFFPVEDARRAGEA